jgi:ribosomal protein L30/L7E
MLSARSITSTRLAQSLHRVTPIHRTLASTSSLTSTPPSPVDEPDEPDVQSGKTHYLVTLLRSPLHLPKNIATTCTSLGLSHRLSSSIVPISRETAGAILQVKELVGIRAVGIEEVSKAAGREWRMRAGEGKQGGGFRSVGTELGVIKVGREKCRGEERGFKVL